MFPRSSLKTCLNCHMWLLNPLLCIYTGLISKTTYIGMCTKVQIILEFSLMWTQLTGLLAFHMPWDHSDSTFHYPIEELYKEPFGYIEGMRNWEQENYSLLLPELILESASLCPLEHFFVIGCGIKFRIQWVPTWHTFDGPLYSKYKKYLNKRVFSGISCFWGRGVCQFKIH